MPTRDTAGSSGYPVPARRHRTEIVDRGSRFIATLERASTVEAARAVIDAVRAELPDATHHVYAFAVGHGASVTHGMSDAGEPSGTAGPPVLAVLRGSDVGDACLVVTRYFGGTKLGTGGLVRAYGDAARQVLTDAPLERKVERSDVRVTVAYAAYEPLVRILEDLDGDVIDSDFAAAVTVTASLPVDALLELRQSVADLTSGEATVDVVD